jgi:hypothetical protein
VCLMLIRGDEGVDINIGECGCEMGDGPEKNSEAGNGASVRTISYVVSGILLVWKGEVQSSHPGNSARVGPGRLQQSEV